MLLRKLNRDLDYLLTNHHNVGQFDGSALIAKCGKIIYENHFGFANRQFKVLNDEKTRFPIASITKFFTAIIILKLREDGLVKLDCPIGNYLPEIVPHNNIKVTVEHLLTHSSGFLNEKVSAYQNKCDLMSFLNSNLKDELLFVPGTKHHYNNLNYVILGAIVEQVTNRSWIDVLKDIIIKPLNLHNTGVIARDVVIDNLAYGYYNYSFGTLSSQPLRNDPPIYIDNYFTAGALFSTTREILKLDSAIDHNHILNEDSKSFLFCSFDSLKMCDSSGSYPLIAGYTNTCVFENGLEKNIIQRDGNINSFNCTYVKILSDNLTLVLLNNTDTADLTKIKDELLDIIVKSEYLNEIE